MRPVQHQRGFMRIPANVQLSTYEVNKLLGTPQSNQKSLKVSSVINLGEFDRIIKLPALTEQVKPN
jgi:hypothetical protein